VPARSPPPAQGMVFDSVMKAANKEPIMKYGNALNQIANNPAVQNKAAIGAIGAAALSAGAAGPAGMVAGQALQSAMRGGRKNKNRRKR